MKILLAALLCFVLGLVTPVAAAEDLPPIHLPINTADISGIEFYTRSGGLSFTVAGQRYILPGHSVDGFNDASSAANLAVLNELRRAAKVTLLVRAPGAQNPGYLDGIIFNYDSLK